jgi:hypothetical protein
MLLWDLEMLTLLKNKFQIDSYLISERINNSKIK